MDIRAEVIEVDDSADGDFDEDETNDVRYGLTAAGEAALARRHRFSGFGPCVEGPATAPRARRGGPPGPTPLFG